MTPAGAGPSNVQSFLIGALGDVATARRNRRLATHGTIPGLVWVMLLSGGVSSPFHGAVTIPPDAYTGVLAEMSGTQR